MSDEPRGANSAGPVTRLANQQYEGRTPAPDSPETKDTAMSGEDIVKAHKEWVEENPLRQWRRDNSVSIHQAASLIGCGVSSIQLWESGTNYPSDRFWDRMTALIGPRVKSRWDRWAEKNPVNQIV